MKLQWVKTEGIKISSTECGLVVPANDWGSEFRGSNCGFATDSLDTVVAVGNSFPCVSAYPSGKWV